MPRADLLVRLVEAGLRGDKTFLKKIVEAIIAEERAKQHTVLAKKLEETLSAALGAPPATNTSASATSPTNSSATNSRAPRLESHENNLVHEITPYRQLADLILPAETNLICQSLIEEQQRRDLLRSYNLEPRNRLLLIGPPGNGKTSLAEAIAEALIVPLLMVRYESVVGSYLGETAGRLKKLFDYASTRRCVLFFDEFEALGQERGDIHETGEIKRVVSSLLTWIDCLPSHVLVIGATNHPELLDRAATLPDSPNIAPANPSWPNRVVRQIPSSNQDPFRLRVGGFGQKSTGLKFRGSRRVWRDRVPPVCP
jgi:SpoVK/Ycf46/Vps4 family AAA+-type ATPase